MSRFSSPRIIKKYGNRRLYDTEDSHYLTQDELAQTIGDGVEVRVVDAKSGRDLTQATLAQIVFEGRGAHQVLPSAVLHEFVRMTDEELAEFLGRHLPGALERFIQGDSGTSVERPMPAPMTYPSRGGGYEEPPDSMLASGIHTSGATRGGAAGPASDGDTGMTGMTGMTQVTEVQEMRRELDELKSMIREVATGMAERPVAKTPRRKRTGSGR